MDKVFESDRESMKRKKRRKKKYRHQMILVLLVSIIVVSIGIICKQEQEEKRSNISLQSIKSKEKNTASKNISQKTFLNSEKFSKKPTLTSKMENHLPILMFHYVTSRPDELPQDSNNIDIAEFENEMKILKQNGYKTMSAKEAQQLLTTKEKPSDKLVWLTFDDGSVTLYTEIFPLLKKYNIHATSFIITNFVNNSQGGILTWEQIKEMKQSGWVDFGSHTANHFDLGTQTAEQQEQELQMSKSDLDKNLNQDTNMICYPAGGYNQDTIDMANHLGYKFGFLDPGRNGAVEDDAKESDGLLTLPRYRMLDITTSTDMMNILKESTDYNRKNTVEN